MIFDEFEAGIQVSFESRRRPPFCLGNTFCTRSRGQNTIANAEATNHQNYHVASGTKMIFYLCFHSNRTKPVIKENRSQLKQTKANT